MIWGAWYLAGRFEGYDCSTCSKSKELKKARGCHERAPNPLFSTDEFGKIWRCPIKLIPGSVSPICQIYQKCRSPVFGHKKPGDEKPSLLGYKPNGILPNAGGLLDQSATLLMVLNWLDRKIIEVIG